MIRQDRAAGQLGDDRRVDAGELRVIHEEPGFSRPAHDRGLDSRFLGVGCRESCVQRHAVCPQERFREVILLQAVEGRSADDGLRLGPQQTAHQKDLAALLGQQTGVSDAVGDVPGVQRRAAQLPGQRQRGASGVQKDEILCGDEGRCRLCDALFWTTASVSFVAIVGSSARN